MSDLKEIYINIRQCFDNLWSLKERGENILEIITPYSTTSSKFVSLYLTVRDGKYIVTDGGLLNSEAYESEIDYENQCLLKILYHLENFYNVKVTKDKTGVKHYYKSTDKAVLVPNIIYDMAQFVSMCVSSATVEFEDAKEKEEKETFRKKANAFIESFVDKENRNFRAYLDKQDFRSVRFSAIIQRNSRLSLVNYITGSNVTNFTNSIARANLNFEIATSSKYDNYIENKVVLLNDTAEGYIPNKLYKHIQILQDHTSSEPIPWSEKEKLKVILN